jgi:hypothetical protein
MCNMTLKHVQHLKFPMKHVQHDNKTCATSQIPKETCATSQIPDETCATWQWNMCNISNSQWNMCNIIMKHMEHIASSLDSHSILPKFQVLSRFGTLCVQCCNMDVSLVHFLMLVNSLKPQMISFQKVMNTKVV